MVCHDAMGELKMWLGRNNEDVSGETTINEKFSKRDIIINCMVWFNLRMSNKDKLQKYRNKIYS